MSLIRTWAPYFQSHIRMRGRASHQEGHVTRLPREEGELFRGQVKAENDQTFLVTIYLDGHSPTASCSCPFFEGGRFCRHIWALIIDVQTNPDAAAVNGDGREALEKIESMAPRFPKARKRPGTVGTPGLISKAPRESEPDWMGRLTLLRPASYALDSSMLAASDAGIAAGGGGRQIVYVVVPELSHRHSGLVVELRQRTPTASGWSKPKPVRITRATLTDLDDPADRELCSLLLGATWVDYAESGEDYRAGRAHAAYRLPPGAARTLLARMIDTGRAMLDVDGDEQLLARESDDAKPWVLWVKGTWSSGAMGQRELIVKAEMRRGGDRLSIDRPTLVHCGGSALGASGGGSGGTSGGGGGGGGDGLIVCDGVVAPFDDRDAARWVTQFRDDLRLRGDVKPIVVPEADVPRFLDRLYMLPQLPEIDLPDDVGRTEHRVTLVPQLEVFSPQRAPGGITGLPKNSLLARTWFAYEDQRVRPGQPGRFLTVKPAAPPESPENPESPKNSESPEATEIAQAAEPGDAPEAPEPLTADPSPLTASDAILIRRDHRAEAQALRLLSNLGLRPLPTTNGPSDRGLLMLLPMRDLPMIATELIGRGWAVSADEQAIATPATPSLSVTSGIDWFELHGKVTYQTATGQQSISLPEILAAIKSGRNMIELGDGTHGLLPEAWLNAHRMLTTMGVVEGDHLRFNAGQGVMLDAMLGRADLIAVDAKFEALRHKLDEFTGIHAVEPPATFHGSLRPYQKEGLGWLAFLRWLGCGGILADDMGLGKTIQVLAMLDARRQGSENGDQGSADSATAMPDSRSARPTLIVVPRSVIFNWIDEAAKFAPALRVQAYTGTERHSLREAFADHDVIVTSYGLMRRDIDELRKHTFDYVVLDEAQAIKNPASQSAKAARLINAQHRLALTGTPVENHLGDLWSIFEFLNPNMLGSSAKFADLVRSAAPAGGSSVSMSARSKKDEDAAVQIGKALRPFILRRTKSQVLNDLPEKTEQTLLCQMEEAQQATYDELKAFYRASLLGKVAFAPEGGDAGGGQLVGRSAIMVLEALLRLRQASCHPGLIDPARADEPSAKLDVLMDRIADLIEEGHKALVFSQFTSMLAIVRKRLDERGILYEYMDGQTRDRKGAVDRFQNDPTIPLFLISLKTGGLGLNLTAAGYVFILDPWWNPAAEQQAIDRAHRIGQTQHVVAYRLICENTVEQRIAELQAKKKRLADAIVGGQQSSLLQQLTRDDLEKLLA